MESKQRTHELVNAACAQLRADLTHFLCHQEQVVDDVLGLARKLGTQHGVLRGDAHGAGVGVALAHHDAAHGQQRRGGKAHLLRAQQHRHHRVAAGAHLPISLHADTTFE